MIVIQFVREFRPLLPKQINKKISEKENKPNISFTIILYYLRL